MTEDLAQRRTPQPMGLAATGVVLLTAALWGGTPTAVKFTTPHLGPITISGIRFGLAGLFMVGWCGLQGKEMRLRPGEWWPCFGAGVLLFVQIGLFTLALVYSNASHSTLCINTFIFWVLVIEHFVTRHDRLNGGKSLGVLLAITGVVALVLTDSPSETTTSEGDTPSLVGDLIMLTSAFVLAVKVVYTKWATTRVEPGKLILWHDIIGTAFFIVGAACFETVRPEVFRRPDVVLGLLYQGVVVGGFCFAVQTALLKRHSASQITVFSFATPLFGTFFAVIFRGDVLSPWLFVAGGCIAAGILTVTLSRRAESTPEIRSVPEDSEAVAAEVSGRFRTGEEP